MTKYTNPLFNRDSGEFLYAFVGDDGMLVGVRKATRRIAYGDGSLTPLFDLENDYTGWAVDESENLIEMRDEGGNIKAEKFL